MKLETNSLQKIEAFKNFKKFKAQVENALIVLLKIEVK